MPPKEHVIDGRTPNRYYYCLNKKCSLPNGKKNPDIRFSHCGAYLRHVMDTHATPDNCILKCPHCPAAFPLYLNYAHHIREHNLRYLLNFRKDKQITGYHVINFNRYEII